MILSSTNSATTSITQNFSTILYFLAHCATTKIRRLTYDEVGDTTTKKKATENLECSSIKRIKMSPAASETSALEASATSTTTEEIEMKKVPPLKIVLPKTKVSGAGGGIGKMHALKKDIADRKKFRKKLYNFAVISFCIQEKLREIYGEITNIKRVLDPALKMF